MSPVKRIIEEELGAVAVEVDAAGREAGDRKQIREFPEMALAEIVERVREIKAYLAG